MKSETILLKVQQRLNKLSSNDFDNIDFWKIIEAFNKVQIEWVRSLLDIQEKTKRTVDDLNVLITDYTLNCSKRGDYYLTDELPSNYLRITKVRPFAMSSCCDKGKFLISDLIEEANSEELLKDWSYSPSFEWGMTFHSIVNNRLKIYSTNFKVVNADLVYYRFPRPIEVINVSNLEGIISTETKNPEFRDDVVEMLIDKTCAEIAGDIESWNQFQRLEADYEKNK